MDPYPALGHINAFLTLADWLSGHGYRVVFSCSPEYNGIIETAGFSFYNLNPLVLLPETYEIKTKGHLKFFMESIVESRNKRLEKYYRSASAGYDQMIERIKPDLILLDDHYATKAFFYGKFDINIILISTMTIPLSEKSVPPFQSAFIPNKSKFSQLVMDFLWMKNRTDRGLGRLVTTTLCIGKTNLKFLKALDKNGWYLEDRSRCFGVGVKGLPIIATHPKPFDFIDFGAEKPVYYFGVLPKAVSGNINDARLAAVLSNSKTKNKPIVYCSLGTITSHDIRICNLFFNKLIRVAGNSPNLSFILNVGNHYDVNQLTPTPGNVSVFSHLPQRELLSQVDLMINHGGINSIKECIGTLVPMIAFPLSLKWDQPGCAARVVYHKIGMMGNIRRDSANIIQAKIGFLMERLNEYRENIRLLSIKIDEANRLENEKILSLIKNYLNNPTTPPNPFFYDSSKKPAEKNPRPAIG